MRQRQSPKSYSKLKYYLLTLFFCTAGFLLLYLSDQYFRIKDIVIVAPSNKIKVNGLENLKNENILLLSENKVEEILTKDNPTLKNFKVNKKYPYSLVISFQKDTSFVAIKTSSGFLYINSSGKILQKDKNNSGNMPILNYYQQLNYNSYNTADRIDLKDVLISLHFVTKARELGLPALSIDIAGVDMIRLNLQNNNNLIFSTEKDVNLQDYQFEKLIKQFKIEGTNFETLDFRFDKPIIKLR